MISSLERKSVARTPFAERLSFSSWARRSIKAVARGVGVEVRRAPKPRIARPEPPPPLFEDPFEAMHYNRGGKAAAFLCPLEFCIYRNGLNFRRDGWHHFTATLEEYREQKCRTYQGSILEAYYLAFQPANALEALIGLKEGPAFLGFLASHLLYLLPWVGATAEEVDRKVRAWYRAEGRQQGCPNIQIENHGLKTHGPVHPEFGEMEFNRLLRVYRSIENEGFIRMGAPVSVMAIKKGDELRYLHQGGVHRMAAMRSLGHETIPVEFKHPWVIDVADVDYWASVRDGRWDRQSALRYIDHLFHFDARSWADERGLLRDR